MSGKLSADFLAGLKSLGHPITILVALIGIGFGYLLNRPETDTVLADTVFLGSITVLVFLLPAAGLVGPHLISETRDLLNIADRCEGSEVASEDLRDTIAAAEFLQRGFSFTLLSVVMAGTAMAQTKATITFGRCPVQRVNVDNVLTAVALALLIGTALTVFPMAWRLLQLKSVKKLSDEISTALTEAQAEAAKQAAAAEAAKQAAAGKGQPPPAQPPDAS